MAKHILILGGARSGKSTFAEQLASAHGGNVIFVATAEALDEEMHARIEKHKLARPNEWRTLEIPYDVATNLGKEKLDSGVVLLDCVTLLVSNIITRNTKDFDNPDEDLLTEKVETELDGLLGLIQTSKADWIVVSNEVGLGLVPPFPLGRVYRDILGIANRQLAQQADEVLFMVAGIPMHLSKKSF
jgi:adenosylcobinamide kinase/adenosylcobinamide-phosphate guanylyltransferase